MLICLRQFPLTFSDVAAGTFYTPRACSSARTLLLPVNSCFSQTHMTADNYAAFLRLFAIALRQLLIEIALRDIRNQQNMHAR